MTVVAVAQLAPVIGEPERNRRTAAGAVREAVSAGAQLVVLPELCDSGYVFESEQEARDLATPADDGPTLRQWRDLAAAGPTVIVGGFCELGTDGRLYNSAALVDASGTRALYRKSHLWDREKLVFTPGGSRPAGGAPAVWPRGRGHLLRPGVPRVGPAARAGRRRSDQPPRSTGRPRPARRGSGPPKSSRPRPTRR